MTNNGPDLATNYIATEGIWLEVTANGSAAERADQIAAAREYVRAIDAYLAGLRACGRQVPHHLDVVADRLRATYLTTEKRRVSYS